MFLNAPPRMQSSSPGWLNTFRSGHPYFIFTWERFHIPKCARVVLNSLYWGWPFAPFNDGNPYNGYMYIPVLNWVYDSPLRKQWELIDHLTQHICTNMEPMWIFVVQQ